MFETLVFYALSGLAIVASALVIGQRNPMYSVMMLIASFGALAGLYIQLDAPFVAVAQIIIYAGAIMVLFLFVVMLLSVPTEEPGPVRRWATGAGPRRFGAVLSAVPRYRSTATNVRLTALSITSIESRIVIKLRRRKMPAVPMAKSTADSIRYEFRVGSGMVARRFLSRDDDRPDHRDEDEHRRELERK